MKYNHIYCVVALGMSEPILEALGVYCKYVAEEVQRLSSANTLLEYQVSRPQMDAGVRMVLVSNNGELLKHVPPSLVTWDLCVVAIKNSPRSIRWVREEMRLLPLCEIAVKGDGTTLQYVPDILRPLHQICLPALKSHPDNLQYLPDPTTLMLDIAIRRDYTAFRYVTEPTPFQCLVAVKIDGRALKYVPEIMHRGVMVPAIASHPEAILYARGLTPRHLKEAFVSVEAGGVRQSLLWTAQVLYAVTPVHDEIVNVAHHIMSVLENQANLYTVPPCILEELTTVVNDYAVVMNWRQ